VTTFSSGNLTPLFTTSVANAGTTPALSFTQSVVSPNQLFGNYQTTNNAPTFFSPTGDLNFVGGAFTVRRLSFGGTSIPISSTAPSSGDCLHYDGTQFAGGTCGGGGGGAGGGVVIVE